MDSRPRPDRKIDGVEVRMTALFILCLALVSVLLRHLPHADGTQRFR